ncbi:MAG: hypothetical protein HY704_13725 [Gemmatimonadetes bacterium]|nr:hypothetical protein [Gemmatimonadota bacterium]
MQRLALVTAVVPTVVVALVGLPTLADPLLRPVPPQLGGTIEGRLVLPKGAPARTVNRYPGTGDAGGREFEQVPAVAFIAGRAGSLDARMPPAGNPQLVQQDTLFRPSILLVPVGTTVGFPNRDPFFHNVFSYSNPRRFDLGRYPQGESKAVRFDAPGIVKVYCEVHKWMRAAIVVVENPHYAVVGADGTFSMPDVPPGRYELVVWHMDRGQKTLRVEVPAQGTVRVEVAL